MPRVHWFTGVPSVLPLPPTALCWSRTMAWVSSTESRIQNCRDIGRRLNRLRREHSGFAVTVTFGVVLGKRFVAEPRRHTACPPQPRRRVAGRSKGWKREGQEAYETLTFACRSRHQTKCSDNMERRGRLHGARLPCSRFVTFY